jgi:hypothetical protein
VGLFKYTLVIEDYYLKAKGSNECSLPRYF